MIDLLADLSAIHRSVASEQGDGGEIVRVSLRRTYPTDPGDLWSALTDPDRLARWFTPVEGDLRPGGRFQLENNASGEILDCEPPQLLRTTFGDASSIVTVMLSPLAAEQTELLLDHVVPLAMAGSVAGALYAGPGWDEALVRLVGHLSGAPTPADHPDLPGVMHQSVIAWVDVVTAAGAAPEEIEPARQAAMAQFAPHVASPS